MNKTTLFLNPRPWNNGAFTVDGNELDAYLIDKHNRIAFRASDYSDAVCVSETHGSSWSITQTNEIKSERSVYEAMPLLAEWRVQVGELEMTIPVYFDWSLEVSKIVTRASVDSLFATFTKTYTEMEKNKPAFEDVYAMAESMNKDWTAFASHIGFDPIATETQFILTNGLLNNSFVVLTLRPRFNVVATNEAVAPEDEVSPAEELDVEQAPSDQPACATASEPEAPVEMRLYLVETVGSIKTSSGLQRQFHVVASNMLRALEAIRGIAQETPEFKEVTLVAKTNGRRGSFLLLGE